MLFRFMDNCCYPPGTSPYSLSPCSAMLFAPTLGCLGRTGGCRQTAAISNGTGHGKQLGTPAVHAKVLV